MIESQRQHDVGEAALNMHSLIAESSHTAYKWLHTAHYFAVLHVMCEWFMHQAH